MRTASRVLLVLSLISPPAFATDAPASASSPSEPALPDTPTGDAATAAVVAEGVAPEAAATIPGATLRAAAGTELEFEMLETVSSKTHARGDLFALRLAAPLMVDGVEIVPAGTPAIGEVVHSAKAGAAGKAGELILAARFLEFDGRRIPLKSFNASVGKSRENTAVGVVVAVGVVGMLVRGSHIELPAGSLVGAKLREDLFAPAFAPAAAASP